MSTSEAVAEEGSPGSGGFVADGATVVDGKWEYRRLRLPPGISRRVAATQLAIHAEFAGWELSTVRLYADGTRRILLRRRYSPKLRLPGLIT